MSLILANQIEASERSAEALEQAWKEEGRRAAVSSDVQELVSSLVHLYRSISRTVEGLHRLPAGTRTRTLCEVNFGLFQRVNGSFVRADKLVRRIERCGYVIRGKEDFAKTWRELRAVLSFSREDIQRSTDQLLRGELRSLGEVRDELRDSPHN